MSNVCILFHYPCPITKLPSYYDQLANELEQSHTVLVVNLMKMDMIDENIVSKIVLFKPDLIITFNNAIYPSIYEKTDCKILVIEADSYPHAFHYIDSMMTHRNKIYIGCLHENSRRRLRNIIHWVHDEQLIVFKNSTSFLNVDTAINHQDINISFIGSFPIITEQDNSISRFLSHHRTNHTELRRIKTILEKSIINIHDITEDELISIQSNFDDLFRYISYRQRTKVLESIADLGLVAFAQISGDTPYLSLLGDLIFSLHVVNEMLTAFDNKVIYDRSKVSVNVHYAHNLLIPELSIYSWRVCDILASQSCLVSTYCPALNQDFSKWVNIPQFSNPSEAYDICKKLLADDHWRHDIIHASQIAIIEGGFTFRDRVRELESLFNLVPNINKNESDYLFLSSSISVQNKSSSIFNRIKERLSVAHKSK